MGWTPFATTVDDRAVMWASKPVEFTSKRGARDGLVGRQASLRRGRGRAARAGSQDGGWRTADGDARRQPSERRSSVSMTAGGGGRRSATIAVCRCQRPSMSSPRPELARRIRHRESPAPGSTAATLPITGSAAAALPTIVSAALPIIGFAASPPLDPPRPPPPPSPSPPLSSSSPQALLRAVDPAFPRVSERAGRQRT